MKTKTETKNTHSPCWKCRTKKKCHSWKLQKFIQICMRRQSGNKVLLKFVYFLIVFNKHVNTLKSALIFPPESMQMILILILSNVQKFDLSPQTHRDRSHFISQKTRKYLMISVFSKGGKLSYDQNFKYSSQLKNIGN